MKKINVIDKSPVFWEDADPVTVQRYELLDDGDKELVFCNHAGHTSEEKETWPTNYDDRTLIFTTLVCDKTNCGAYKMEDDSLWQDTPVGGRHE